MLDVNVIINDQRTPDVLCDIVDLVEELTWVKAPNIYLDDVSDIVKQSIKNQITSQFNLTQEEFDFIWENFSTLTEVIFG
jgi:hypothetical protein